MSTNVILLEQDKMSKVSISKFPNTDTHYQETKFKNNFSLSSSRQPRKTETQVSVSSLQLSVSAFVEIQIIPSCILYKIICIFTSFYRHSWAWGFVVFLLSQYITKQRYYLVVLTIILVQNIYYIYLKICLYI